MKETDDKSADRAREQQRQSIVLAVNETCEESRDDATVNQVIIGKQLVTRHATAAVDLAMELASDAGFYRAARLERQFRDIQAARYHPLQSRSQAEFAGAMALGLPVDQIF
jgi:alkylation response protein AidB-like acyl-CoA dehydrogenase